MELRAMSRLNCREPLFCHFNPSAVEMERPTKKEEKTHPIKRTPKNGGRSTALDEPIVNKTESVLEMAQRL